MSETTSPHRQQPERWILRQSRPVSRDLLLTVLWTMLAGGITVVQARLLARACHLLVMDHAAVARIWPLAGIIALAALGRAALHLLAERRAAAAAATLKQGLRNLLYLRLRDTGNSRGETGPLVEAVTTGIDGLEPYVTRFLPQLAMAALLPLLILAAVVPAEWRASLVLLFSAPFIPLFMVLIGRGAESLNRRQWQRLSRMAAHFLDLVLGLPDLRIFAAAKREACLVTRVSAEYRLGTMAVLRVAFLSALALEFFSTVGTAVVAVLIGFQLLHGSLTLLNGLFILLLAPEFYLPFRTLGLSYHARMQGIAAAEHIAPLMEPTTRGSQTGHHPPATPRGAPAIRFDTVSWRRESGRGGLTGITLDLPAGSFTVLVGESGAGKTTLARLLVGLEHPDEGTISVDGEDLHLLAADSWRSRLAWVSQRPFFFKGTIRENLLLGVPAVDDRSLRAALDAAAAGLFLDRLPAGLDTPLGDRGAGLSGGELRRLALARALLRNASLVVLDEPTAGLDRENELLVLQTLERLSTGRTVLVISHREEVIARANQVVVIHAGHLQGSYSPEEYLATAEAAP
jgi:ATP-binding cassette, subfamily C, bacterial CydD